MQASTDFNRNGIPDQLEGQQQGFGFTESVLPTTSSFVDVVEQPTQVEIIEKPAIVHEVLKTEQVTQIQPIIEREREQLDVYEVVQPMREREVIATEVRQGVLPAQTRATVVQDNSAFLAARSAPSDYSTREVANTRSQVIQNAPIVHETVNHRVIEEVQPVIYKEIDRPVLVKETLPIQERVIEAPRSHHTVLPTRDLGVRSAQGFTDYNRDGIPDQLQGGSYQSGFQPGLNSQTVFQSGLNTQGAYANQGVSGSDLTLKDKLTAKLPGHQFQDNNGNGIPDRMEGRSKDLNRNGIPDQLERQGAQPGFVGQQGYAQQGLNQQGFQQGYVQQGIPQQGFQHSIQGANFPVSGLPYDSTRSTTYISQPQNQMASQVQGLATSGYATAMPQEFVNRTTNVPFAQTSYRDVAINPHPQVVGVSSKRTDVEDDLAARLAQAVHVANVRRV